MIMNKLYDKVVWGMEKDILNNTLSVSTPVMNSCSTVRLSKKASEAVTRDFSLMNLSF